MSSETCEAAAGGPAGRLRTIGGSLWTGSCDVTERFTQAPPPVVRSPLSGGECENSLVASHPHTEAGKQEQKHISPAG